MKKLSSTQEYKVTCDRCARVTHPKVREFFTMISEIKHAGWGVIKKGNGWEHYCPACKSNGQVSMF